MRRCCLLPIFFLLCAVRLQAGPLPLTAKDVALMLRAGDSNAMVTQELTRRHFVDTLDPEKENTLIKAGAKPDLIDALRNGAYSLSPEQSAKAQARMAEVAQRRAAEAEESQKLEAIHEDQVIKKRTSDAPKQPDVNATADYLKGYLVRMNNGSLVRADDEAIGRKRLIAYYFSAHWCGPCRKFTPQLIEYYNRVAAQHPEFEIVFYSMDRSAADMEKYMRESNMPWPAIDYAKRAEKKEVAGAAGEGIPSLVLVESTGRLISSSFADGKYRGTQKVLDDLDSIFGGTSPSQIAQANTN